MRSRTLLAIGLLGALAGTLVLAWWSGSLMAFARRVEEKVQPAQPARPPRSTVDVFEWSVVDPFPEARYLSGAMQMRQHPLRDDIFYVATFKGTIYELRRDEDGLHRRIVVDLRDTTLEWLFSFALHPNFRGDGTGDDRIFLHYTTDIDVSPMYLRIAEITLPSGGWANARHERVLIQNDIEHKEHVGGGVEFDDRGFLLVSIGDNGWRDDDHSTSQKIDEGLFSGILRIDIDRRGGDVSHPPLRQPVRGTTQGYFIPNGNPFVGRPGVLEEFWALGFRNPWRISFDAPRQALWAGEVGQNDIEQVELVRAGTNHEWSFKEGGRRFERSYLEGRMPNESIGQLTSPFYEYEHVDQDYCVVGGFVYRGDEFPELTGMYIFGDNQSSRVWAIDPEDASRKRLLLRLPHGKWQMSLTSISGDRAGNIYFTSFASRSEASVLQLARAKPANMPERLSEAAIFRDLASLEVEDGFEPYDVNAPLWSDGMTKRRWLRLPEGGRIDNAVHDEWTFPQDTVFVKHFEEPTGDRRPIETRVLTVKSDGHVYGATYIWNDDRSDAFLEKERTTQILADAEGESFEYRIPGARDCVVCHSHDNPVLGVNGLQLSGRPSSKGEGDTIVAWSEREMLEQPVSPGAASALPALAALDDPAASLEHRVRSYLHSNCAFCHYEGGTKRTHFDARFTVPLAEAGIVGVLAQTKYVPIDDRRADFVVSPGNPEDSAIFLRLGANDRERSMPYLGRTVPHDAALAAVAEWIAALPAP